MGGGASAALSSSPLEVSSSTLVRSRLAMMRSEIGAMDIILFHYLLFDELLPRGPQFSKVRFFGIVNPNFFLDNADLLSSSKIGLCLST